MPRHPHNDGAHPWAVSSVRPLSWAAFVVVFYHSNGLQNEDSFLPCSLVFGLGSSVLEFCRNRTPGRSSVAISIYFHSSFVRTSLHNLELLRLVQVTGCRRALESCVCGRSRCKGLNFLSRTTVCCLKGWTIRFLNSVELCSQHSVHTRNRDTLSYSNCSGWCPPKYRKNVHTLPKALCANSITFLLPPPPP